MSFTIVLNQIITMFLIASVGYFLFKREWISNETIKELSNILLKIVTPLILIKNLYLPNTPENLQLLRDIFLIAGISILIGFIVGQVVFRKEQGIERFVAGFSNSGFLGIPLVSGIIGEHAVIYIIPVMVFQSIAMWTYGVNLLSKEKVKFSFKTLIKNPVIVSFMAALIIFFAQIKIPEVVMSSINYLSSLNTPLAMIILGTYVAQVNRNNSVAVSKLVLPILVRLVIIPLMIIMLYKFLPFHNTEMLLALTIVISAPAATATVMFAAVYDNDYLLATQLVSYTTILSALSLPLVVMLALKVLGG